MKVAIVGCGKITDAHAWAISLIPDAEIVGVCDKEELMARQLADRFQIKRFFLGVEEMLETARPDVVHITTPPQSHYELGKLCLYSGCHAYIEKPFTLNAKEAEELIHMAEERNLKLTVGTDEQYSHVSIRMRDLIRQGYLGGPPVHMDAYYCYDLSDKSYAKAFLNNRTHWIRMLPGQLMQNNISHGIARIAEYWPEDNAKVLAHGFTSSFLKTMGERSLIDELRATIIGGDNATAYFTFSTQMRPLFIEFRIFGPKNGLMLNQHHHSLIELKGISYKSYLNKLKPLRDYQQQYRKNMLANAKLFMKREFQMKEGLFKLIAAFYKSISENSPPPISYREILLTSRIMDSIFSQVHAE